MIPQSWMSKTESIRSRGAWNAREMMSLISRLLRFYDDCGNWSLPGGASEPVVLLLKGEAAQELLLSVLTIRRVNETEFDGRWNAKSRYITSYRCGSLPRNLFIRYMESSESSRRGRLGSCKQSHFAGVVMKLRILTSPPPSALRRRRRRRYGERRRFIIVRVWVWAFRSPPKRHIPDSVARATRWPLPHQI